MTNGEKEKQKETKGNQIKQEGDIKATTTKELTAILKFRQCMISEAAKLRNT